MNKVLNEVVEQAAHLEWVDPENLRRQLRLDGTKWVRTVGADMVASRIWVRYFAPSVSCSNCHRISRGSTAT